MSPDSWSGALSVSARRCSSFAGRQRVGLSQSPRKAGDADPVREIRSHRPACTYARKRRHLDGYASMFRRQAELWRGLFRIYAARCRRGANAYLGQMAGHHSAPHAF